MRGQYYDPPDNYPNVLAFPVRRPRARRTYVCDHCAQPIAQGERHYYQPYIDYDAEPTKFGTQRYHIQCPWERNHP